MFFPRSLSPLLALFLLLATLFAGPAAAQVQLVPDACISQLTPGTVTTTVLAGAETTVFTTPGALAGKKVVLLVSGNCQGSHSYTALANHLALNGFIVGRFVRAGNVASVPAVFDAVDAVLAHVGIALNDPDLKIALVGHSVGGRLVIEAAQANTDQNLDYPISAVATLAPVASLVSELDGWDVKAYLSLYGSQDDDVSAYTVTVDEAFYAYDVNGTESSTTCNVPPCFATEPGFQKTMVFVYGADHAGLVGVNMLPGACGTLTPQNLDYLSAADTLCITKAYVTGFLRWHLWGDSVYKGMLRGEWKPLSILGIDTAEADGFGNPAGSPLRLFFQNSPVQHKTIKNFNTGLGTYTISANAVIQHATVGASSGAPYRVRHNTASAMIGWEGGAGSKWVRFEVPTDARNGSNYTHFSLRLGQLEGAPVPYNNPVNTDQDIWVGLQDGNGAISWHQVNDIPAPDRYTDSGTIRAQTHMSTRRISLASIAGINEADVRGVYIYFNANTAGTVVVDSLEWHRD